MRFFEKVADDNNQGTQFIKKYVTPSILTGGLIGAGIFAATKEKGVPFISKKLGKDMLLGVGADVATSIPVGLWADKQNKKYNQ